MFYIVRIYDKSSCSYKDSAIVRFCTIDYIRYGNSGDKYLFYVFDTNDFSYEIVDINVIMKAIEKQVVIEGISIMEDRNSIYGSLYIKPAVIPMDNLFMCKCLGLRESYQDYLNAFNEFLKSKDYQDSKKARKEC